MNNHITILVKGASDPCNTHSLFFVQNLTPVRWTRHYLSKDSTPKDRSSGLPMKMWCATHAVAFSLKMVYILSRVPEAMIPVNSSSLF